jgi:hypothetical protein
MNRGKQVETEWIMLADRVEVINNKLYVMGGGWETLTVNAVPAQHAVAVAVAFSVPWSETNQQHDIQIEILDQESKSLVKVDGQIEVGHPSGVPFGQGQHIQMGVNLGLTIEKLGPHSIATRIEGQESKRITFNVVAGQGLTPRLPST